MTKDLIELIKELPKEKRPDEKPGGNEYVEEMETTYSLKLPQDYLNFIKIFHFGTIKGDQTVIHLESPNMLIGHNMDERFEESIPGMFVIGDDAGGSVYFYDPENRLGHGNYSIFIVPLGSLFFEDSIFAGHDLTEVVIEIIKGVNFFDRPTLEQEGKI